MLSERAQPEHIFSFMLPVSMSSAARNGGNSNAVTSRAPRQHEDSDTESEIYPRTSFDSITETTGPDFVVEMLSQERQRRREGPMTRPRSCEGETDLDRETKTQRDRKKSYSSNTRGSVRHS